jgi:uncharacterized membrane protein
MRRRFSAFHRIRSSKSVSTCNCESRLQAGEGRGAGSTWKWIVYKRGLMYYQAMFKLHFTRSELNMPIISLQEIMLVMLAAAAIILYHAHLYIKVRRDPLKTAIGIGNHARYRWVREIMRNQRDILAIQTLRNQVMAAIFLASTAILISLGLLNAAFRPSIFDEISHALNLVGTTSEILWMFKMMLLGVLFFIAFFNFTLAIRYNNHGGIMINAIDLNDPTLSADTVTNVLNHGALHYTIGMRAFYLSVSLGLWTFGPIWMLVGSLIVISVLYRLDREA